MNNMQFDETTQTFSGTLFRSRVTNQTVLGFRFTEFFDDTARDNKATSEMEIKNTGGRIADTQDWYAELKNDDTKLGAGQAFSVTGYSLGGHLTTAFKLLRIIEAREQFIGLDAAFKLFKVGAVQSGAMRNAANPGPRCRNRERHSALPHVHQRKTVISLKEQPMQQVSHHDI